MMPERISQLEYISMTTSTRAAFVFRAPPLSYVANIYYLPFTAAVWICLIILMVVSMIVIYITYKLPKASTVARHRQETVSDFFLLFMEIVSQMGSYFTPNKPSGRISFVTMKLKFINGKLKN